jgi:hypothetical protein
MGATNPSGWSGVIKVKTPAGTTLGYILLYSNPRRPWSSSSARLGASSQQLVWMFLRWSLRDLVAGICDSAEVTIEQVGVARAVFQRGSNGGIRDCARAKSTCSGS